MDRIILSLTYGKKCKRTIQRSRAWPVEQKRRERRLNVAITRSRNGLTIVSSLKVADLLTTNAQSEASMSKRFSGRVGKHRTARTFGIGSERFERKK